jgi:hypothetical protein
LENYWLGSKHSFIELSSAGHERPGVWSTLKPPAILRGPVTIIQFSARFISSRLLLVQRAEGGGKPIKR